MTGSIFDRWGNLVFSTKSIPFSWSGRFNDEEAMPGVYVLVLSWEFNDGGEIRSTSVSADIALLR
jgi:hypothetical protein